MKWGGGTPLDDVTPLVPTMTNNTSPSPYEAVGTSKASDTYDYFKPFDNVASSGWTALGNAEESVIGIKLNAPKTVIATAITFGKLSSPFYDGVAYDLVYSDDGSTWNSIRQLGTTELTAKFHFVSNNASHLYYGIKFKGVINIANNKTALVNDLQFYGY